MLSDKMVELLNAQINLEFASSNIYLQMSAWAESEGLTGCARFLKLQAAEEMEHMQKFFDYVLEKDAMSVLGAIPAPPREFESISDLFQRVYKHECHVTESINKIVNAAHDERDWATFNFLQWFVTEQVEEEATAKGILDKINLLGDKESSLYFIDRELAGLAASRQH